MGEREGEREGGREGGREREILFRQIFGQICGLYHSEPYFLDRLCIFQEAHRLYVVCA